MATNPAYAHVHQPALRPIRRSEYVAAHRELLEAMRAMEELTRAGTPGALRFSHTRLRVTRASMERRELFRRVVDQLSRNSTAATGRTVALLQQHDVELMEMTSAHVAVWTGDRIKGDWDGYCRSTSEIRARSRENIKRETELLYPLLRDDS